MTKLSTAVSLLRKGSIIAYPTEAVYGLGCDPFNESAVLNLLALKNRSITKGLILIAATLEQLMPYIVAIPKKQMQIVLKSWPGPVTWLFPKTPNLPYWISGNHPTVAVRVTAHPVASALCRAFGQPLVSTSANEAEHPPARHAEMVSKIFSDKIAGILEGDVGQLGKPTPIYDAMTGEVIRE